MGTNKELLTSQPLEAQQHREAKFPNGKTQNAMEELNAGKGKDFASVADLMADLHDVDSSAQPPENQESSKETDHLLRSPTNARRLMDSIESLRNGEGKERKIPE